MNNPKIELDVSNIELKILNEKKTKPKEKNNSTSSPLSKLQAKTNDENLEDEARFRRNLKKNKFLPIPKNILFLSVLLLIIGTVFLPIGVNDFLNTPDQKIRGLAFLIFGSLMFLPGFYYSFQLYRACMAGSPEERAEILEDLPQIAD